MRLRNNTTPLDAMAPDAGVQTPWESTRIGYYARYSLGFVILACVAFAFLFASGKSLIWNPDGLTQHFTFFCYIGEWVRNAFSTGEVPLWDFSIGYGSDIITSLATWIGDPFNILSVIVPTGYSEYAYQAAAVLRLFFAGIAFSAFCCYRGKAGWPTLLGAWAYAFCGFCLVNSALRHVMFGDAAILLPLVLLGADRIFDGKDPAVFLAFTSLTFISYFYFAYMIGIFLLLYCLLRYFTGERKRSLSDFVSLTLRFILYSLVCAAVSAALLLPIVQTVLQMGRLSAGVTVPTFYELGQYLLLPGSIAGADGTFRSISMEVLAAFCIIALFATKTLMGNAELRPVKIAFAAMTVFALVPFFGHVLNGMSYASDRWMFAYAMCMSYIIVLVVPRIRDFSSDDWKRIFIASGILELWMAACAVVWFNRVWYLTVMILFAAFIVALYLAVKHEVDTSSDHIRAIGPGSLSRLLVVVCCIGLTAGIGVLASFQLMTNESDNDKTRYVDDMIDFGEALNLQTVDQPNREVASVVSDHQNPSRYDQVGNLTRRNATALTGLYSTNFYASIYNQNVDDFRTELALPVNSTLQSHEYNNNDSRSFVENVSGVTDILVRSNATKLLPYGYSSLEATDTIGKSEYRVYSSSTAPGIAFTYDSVISSEEYASFSPIQKQEALLQGCVIDAGNSAEAVKSISPTVSSVDLAYSVDDSSTATVLNKQGMAVSGDEAVQALQHGGSVSCVNEKATLVLNYSGVAEAETYLYWDTLDCRQYYPSERALLTGETSDSPADSLRLWIEDRKTQKLTNYDIFMQAAGGLKKSMVCDTDRSNFYDGKHTWLVNTGYSDAATNSITITFGSSGEYSLDGLRVLVQPISVLPERLSALSADPVSLRFGVNTVETSVDASTEKMLYLAIPFSEGWKATCDGEAVDILKANTAFMAIPIDAGTHEIRLSYETPYLRLGIAISAVGIVCATILAYRGRTGKKRSRQR